MRSGDQCFGGEVVFSVLLNAVMLHSALREAHTVQLSLNVTRSNYASFILPM